MVVIGRGGPVVSDKANACARRSLLRESELCTYKIQYKPRLVEIQNLAYFVTLNRHWDTSFSDVMLQDQGSVAIRWWRPAHPLIESWRENPRATHCCWRELYYCRVERWMDLGETPCQWHSKGWSFAVGGCYVSTRAFSSEMRTPFTMLLHPRNRETACISSLRGSSHCFCLSKFGLPAMLPAMFQLWPMRLSAISLQ